MDGEWWRSELPDGTSHALADNLDVALAQAIHAETDAGHTPDVHYPTWIRSVADKITSER